MKTYRRAVADAYAMCDLLEYLAGRADSLADDVIRYRARAEESGDVHDDDSYDMQCVAECQAKADAFERLLEKLSR